MERDPATYNVVTCKPLCDVCFSLLLSARASMLASARVTMFCVCVVCASVRPCVVSVISIVCIDGYSPNFFQ